MSKDRVLRHAPDRSCNLGHYHGALKNWVALRSKHECFFCGGLAWRHLSHYDDPRVIEQSTPTWFTDWLAAGSAKSIHHLPAKVRCHNTRNGQLLLGMITPPRLV